MTYCLLLLQLQVQLLLLLLLLLALQTTTITLTFLIHCQGRSDGGYIRIYTPKISPGKLFMG